MHQSIHNPLFTLRKAALALGLGLSLSPLPLRAQAVGLPNGAPLSQAYTVVFFSYYGDAEGYIRGFWLYGTNGNSISAIPKGKALVITDVYADASRNVATSAQAMRFELRAAAPPVPTTPPPFTAGRLGAWEARFEAGQTTSIGSQSWRTGLVFTADRVPYVVYTPGAVSLGYAIVRAQGYMVDVPTTVVLSSAP